MRASYALFSAVVTAATLVGCGGSSDTPAVTGSTSPSARQTASTTPTAAATAPIPADPIAKVVYDFLEAVRRGDAQQAGQLMTPLALQKTSEMDYVFAPPGSSTARFQVGAVGKVGEGEAVVESVWSDLDADGKVQDDPIVWALRLNDGVWRISGMVAYMGDDAEPLTVDFENPASMAPQQPVDPNRVVDAPAPGPGQAAGEVARNPFEGSSQR